MLTGGHAPVQGFTQRAKEASAILGDQIMLWTSAEGAQDAIAGMNLVRCPNWAADEDTNSYLGKVAPLLNAWAHIPKVIFVLGNEPDREAGHHGERILEMTAAIHGVAPWAILGNPPLSVEASSSVNPDGCQAVMMHSYFERQYPADSVHQNLGASYRYGLAIANNRPVYVSEFNVVQTSSGIDWPDRNQKAADWLNQAEGDGVAGVCLFILDANGDPDHTWDSFDVGPEAASDILARRMVVPVPDPPAPPPPAPVPTPNTYTRAYDPRGYRPLDQRWLPFIKQYNLPEAAVICGTYDMAAERIGYDANAMIAQGCVETGVFTSHRWRLSHNAAGIGIFSDGTPDIIWGPQPYGDVATGIAAQADLLTDYFLDGSEPFGTLAPHNFGGARRGDTMLSDLDGVWAADPDYSIAIVGYLITVLGSGPILPMNGYQIVTPVDCPVLQGSDGAFSHGGHSPGFYAIDYGCIVGTPVRAAADGVVGTTYWTDGNPISLRTGHSIWIDHYNGYSTFSCHLSRFDVSTGERVVQGQIIGLTGDPASEPNNGLGDGPHLHWEIWDTARHLRIKMEDLEAAGIAGPYSAVATPTYRKLRVPMVGDGFNAAEIERQWYGTDKPSAAQKKNFPYNVDFGIEQAYGALLNGTFNHGDQDYRSLSIAPGACISKEEFDPGTPGRSVRYFANGKITAIKQADGTYAFKWN